METYPQVFVGMKFTKGCDDTMAMKKSGELQKLLKKQNIAFKEE